MSFKVFTDELGIFKFMCLLACYAIPNGIICETHYYYEP